MKNKIAEILDEYEYSLYHGIKTSKYVAHEILDLINLEKAKENCYQEDKMRLNGWLHKDDPVKGLKVVRSCEHKNYNCAYDCKLKLDTCIEESDVPLTVEEALEIFELLIESNYLLTELTTKDGGVIVMGR